MIGRATVVAVVATVAACASSTPERRATAVRVEPTPMDNVRWDPATGTLGCVASNAQLTLARDLHNRVQVIARDLVVVVLPQASSALLVTVSPSYLRGKRAGVLGDLPEIWKELHKQATGVDLRDGDVQGEFRARATAPALSAVDVRLWSPCRPYARTRRRPGTRPAVAARVCRDRPLSDRRDRQHGDA